MRGYRIVVSRREIGHFMRCVLIAAPVGLWRAMVRAQRQVLEGVSTSSVTLVSFAIESNASTSFHLASTRINAPAYRRCA